MTQVIIHKTIRKFDQQESLVGSDAKNALPTIDQKSDSDFMGLSCLIIDDPFEDYA